MIHIGTSAIFITSSICFLAVIVSTFKFNTASSSNNSIATLPAVVDIGFAEKVPECGCFKNVALGFSTSIISDLPAKAPIGKPPPIILPKAVKSGLTE